MRRFGTAARLACVLAVCLWLGLGTDVFRLSAGASPSRESVERPRILESCPRPLAVAPPAAELLAHESPAPFPFQSSPARETVPPERRRRVPAAFAGGAPTQGETAFTQRVLRTLSPLCRLAWG